MIVLDTSALMAIILDEPGCAACMTILEATGDAVISAGTMAEALIVSARRGVRAEMERLIDGLGLQIAPVTAAAARRVAVAYDQWGKGVSPAGLNFGDCFAYAEAKFLDFPLLFVGGDFTRTDIRTASA
jgi:ribonuclease VapC